MLAAKTKFARVASVYGLVFCCGNFHFVASSTFCCGVSDFVANPWTFVAGIPFFAMKELHKQADGKNPYPSALSIIK